MRPLTAVCLLCWCEGAWRLLGLRLQAAQASPCPVGCLLRKWNHGDAEQLVSQVPSQAFGGCLPGLPCLSCLHIAETLRCLLGMLLHLNTL